MVIVFYGVCKVFAFQQHEREKGPGVMVHEHEQAVPFSWHNYLEQIVGRNILVHHNQVRQLTLCRQYLPLGPVLGNAIMLLPVGQVLIRNAGHQRIIYK